MLQIQASNQGFSPQNHWFGLKDILDSARSIKTSKLIQCLGKSILTGIIWLFKYYSGQAPLDIFTENRTAELYCTMFPHWNRMAKTFCLFYKNETC